MYRNLVIGKGEVGTAVSRILQTSNDVVFAKDIEEADFDQVDVLHICYPWSDKFVDSTRQYIEQYAPELVIVYSTVPIGTCETIGYNIAHSPIEGVHPDLDRGIYYFTRWIGCADDRARDDASRFWYRFVREVATCKSSRYTEFLKLRSTAKYGVNIVWTDYEKQAADGLGMHFDCIKAYDEGYNKLYRDLGLFQYQRYILDPPEGKIGGHCIVPNAELLDKQFPSSMLKAIKKMRKK